MSIRILELYGYVTLQGLPHHGLRAYGVPPGGAFDQESHAIANAVVGNSSDALTLEMAMTSIRFEALQACRLGIAGAECQLVRIVAASSASSGFSMPFDGHLNLGEGDIVDIKPSPKHARKYIAISGGFIGKVGELIKRGSTLHRNPSTLDRLVAFQPVFYQSSLVESAIGVIPFGSNKLPEELQTHPFDVSLQSDRVGVRLEGAKFPGGPESLSEPACPGTIQVTNDGNLVILGADGPTIGGYRKLGVVCSADLNMVAQLRPGNQCRFTEITAEQAVHYHARRQKQLMDAVEHVREGMARAIAYEQGRKPSPS